MDEMDEIGQRDGRMDIRPGPQSGPIISISTFATSRGITGRSTSEHVAHVLATESDVGVQAGRGGHYVAEPSRAETGARGEGVQPLLQLHAFASCVHHR
jgi:hypothetical protein